MDLEKNVGNKKIDATDFSTIQGGGGGKKRKGGPIKGERGGGEGEES